MKRTTRILALLLAVEPYKTVNVYSVLLAHVPQLT